MSQHSDVTASLSLPCTGLPQVVSFMSSTRQPGTPAAILFNSTISNITLAPTTTPTTNSTTPYRCPFTVDLNINLTLAALPGQTVILDLSDLRPEACPALFRVARPRSNSSSTTASPVTASVTAQAGPALHIRSLTLVMPGARDSGSSSSSSSTNGTESGNSGGLPAALTLSQLTGSIGWPSAGAGSAPISQQLLLDNVALVVPSHVFQALAAAAAASNSTVDSTPLPSNTLSQAILNSTSVFRPSGINATVIEMAEMAGWGWSAFNCTWVDGAAWNRDPSTQPQSLSRVSDYTCYRYDAPATSMAASPTATVDLCRSSSSYNVFTMGANTYYPGCSSCHCCQAEKREWSTGVRLGGLHTVYHVTHIITV